MKKGSLFALNLAVLLLVSMAFTACKEQGLESARYVVSFDSAGGGMVASQTVKDGELAVKPQDPTRLEYDFGGWYIGETEYDFNLPVTKDITLTAKWTPKAPVEYTVTFDTAGGGNTLPQKVIAGECAQKPYNPVRRDYCFDGWYIGESKYDFGLPVTQNITVTAKWLEESEVKAKMTAALTADYSDYTSERTVAEIYEGEEYSYTVTYKRTSSLAYYKQVQEGINDSERYIVLDGNGNSIAGYYLQDAEWKKSPLVSFADFVLPLHTEEITADDFTYSEGKYYVARDSLDVVEYALFRGADGYSSITVEIDNGFITHIYGEFASGDMFLSQKFSAYGETVLALPDIPPVEVIVNVKSREIEEGAVVDINELTDFLFTVSVDGRALKVTPDMVDIGSFNAANPAEGAYTFTFVYETWDGVTHSKTATVRVNKKQAVIKTFAEIFGADYSNVTVNYNNAEYIRRGDLYYWQQATNKQYALINNSQLDKRVTHNTNTGSITNQSKPFAKMPRIDLIFALSADLFTAKEGAENVYELKNNTAVAGQLADIFIFNELNNTSYVIETSDTENYPFSVEVTVSGDYVSKIVLSYYSKMKTGTTRSLKTATYQLSQIGSSDTIEMDDGVRNILYPTAEQTAYIDERKYSA